LFWGISTIIILLMILFFGLRPKGLQLENPVTFLPGKKAIVFKRHGIAYVNDLKTFRESGKFDALTVELAVRSTDDGAHGFGSLLMLHDGSDRRQLFMGQWQSYFVVMNGDDYDHTENRPRLSVKGVFSNNKTRFITVTADESGTRIYIDGLLAAANKDWQMQVPQKGKPLRMVVGNSVTAKGSWIGEIFGLALCNRVLSPEQVTRHFERWQQENQFPIETGESPLAYYTFDSIQNDQVADLSGNGQALHIPSKPVVLEKIVLSPPWSDFKPDFSLLLDVVLNVIGFIPLGFAMSGLLKQSTQWPVRMAVPAILVFCFSVSLGIEIIQAWMPTRSSSLLDLILNTLGAGMGIWIFSRRGKMVWFVR